jgi:hypothetical protein
MNLESRKTQGGAGARNCQIPTLCKFGFGAIRARAFNSCCVLCVRARHPAAPALQLTAHSYPRAADARCTRKSSQLPKQVKLGIQLDGRKASPGLTCGLCVARPSQ